VIIEDSVVKGVVTGDLGVARDGHHKADYTPGMNLLGKYTLFAEGARGSLSKVLGKEFRLHEGREPQKFGIGLKELWELPQGQHKPGLVLHGFGWPLDDKTGGGLFMYHWGQNYCSVGFVIHLNYQTRIWTLPGIPTFKDASPGSQVLGRRKAHRLRGARHHGRRLPVGPEVGISGWGANRLRRGVR